jgi:hypothetical protein
MDKMNNHMDEDDYQEVARAAALEPGQIIRSAEPLTFAPSKPPNWFHRWMQRRAPRELLSDATIVAIRDSLLPSQGEPFDCIAFARAILSAEEYGDDGVKWPYGPLRAHCDSIEDAAAKLQAWRDGEPGAEPTFGDKVREFVTKQRPLDPVFADILDRHMDELYADTAAPSPAAAERTEPALDTVHCPACGKRGWHNCFGIGPSVTTAERAVGAEDIRAAAWIMEWLATEKYRKPDVPQIIEDARKHYREEMKRLEAAEAQNAALQERLDKAEHVIEAADEFRRGNISSGLYDHARAIWAALAGGNLPEQK